jgi:hypothetical protein
MSVTNIKHPAKKSISSKRVKGYHLFKPSLGSWLLLTHSGNKSELSLARLIAVARNEYKGNTA